MSNIILFEDIDKLNESLESFISDRYNSFDINNPNDIREYEENQIIEADMKNIKNEIPIFFNDNSLDFKDEEDMSIFNKNYFLYKEENFDNFDNFEDSKLIRILDDYIPQDLFINKIYNNKSKSNISKNNTKENTNSKKQNNSKKIQNSFSFNNSYKRKKKFTYKIDKNDNKKNIINEIKEENEGFKLFNICNHNNYINSFIDKSFPFNIDLEGNKEKENSEQKDDNQKSNVLHSMFNFEQNNSLFIRQNNYALNTFIKKDYSINNKTKIYNNIICKNVGLYDKNNNISTFTRKKRKRDTNIFKNNKKINDTKYNIKKNNKINLSINQKVNKNENSKLNLAYINYNIIENNILNILKNKIIINMGVFYLI